VNKTLGNWKQKKDLLPTSNYFKLARYDYALPSAPRIPFNAKSSKSTAPLAQPRIARDVASMESVLDFGVRGRRQCLQDQPQRAPRVWARSNV